MWGTMDHFGDHYGDMGLGMLFFWGLLILAGVLLLRCSLGGGTCGRRGGEKSALDILKERYARGEIDKEEFEQKKRDLSA